MMCRDTAQAAPNPSPKGRSGRVSVERRISLAIALLLLSSFFVQGIAFIRANSQTYDEAAHLVAGYSYLVTRDFRLDSEHPPLIKELLALPLLIRYHLPFNPDPQRWQHKDAFRLGLDFLYRAAVPADQMLSLARLASLLIGAWLIALVGWWAYRLWGREAALLAMALASFDPNLIAHSSLVTTDIGVSAAIVSTLYGLWEYANRPTWRLLVGTGLAAGIALAAKYSALALLPIIVLIAFMLFFTDSGFVLPLRNNPRRPMDRAIHAAAVLVVIFSISLLVIPPVYLVHSTDTWWSGLQLVLTIIRDGRPSFYFGDYSYDGWWSYHLTAFLFKTPVGTLLLFGLSLGLQTTRTRLTWRTAAFLVAPIIVICALTTQSKLAVGLRHILPIYPFVFILAGRVAALRWGHRQFALFLISVCVAFAALSSLRVAPHQLAYFNELVGGPNRGHRYLLDSNLDWGQDLKAVKAYMEREKVPIIYLSYFGTAPPSYYGIRYQFVPGTWPLESPPMEKVPVEAQRKLLAISVNNLQDLAKPSYPLFQWLRQREPIAKLGYSIFIYDLTDDSPGLANLEETYYKAGLSPP
jgi:Dolichyl-phosphate-mannose-protein mannosyltransferase